MNIENVRTFLKVIEAGNLNKAASALHLTQSAVTARIQSLENELGQSLFIRNKSGTELTAAGFRFQRYADVLVQTWNQARHELGLPKGFQTVCHIGCHPELWYGVVDQWLEGLRARCPQVALSLTAADQSDLIRWIADGRVDVALILDPIVCDGWTVEKLFDDLLVEVSTIRRDLVRWDEKYVYVDLGADYRRQHAYHYPVDETPSVVFHNSAWALEYLLKQGGSAYLPKRLVDHHIARGDLHPVNGAPDFTRSAYVAFNGAVVEKWEWFHGALKYLASLCTETPR